MPKSISNYLLVVTIFQFCFLPLLAFSGNGEDINFKIVKSHHVDMMLVTAADLDLDNRPDLIFSGWLGGSSISFGKGFGEFESPVSLLTDGITVFAVDFVNSDNLPDIVAASGLNGKAYKMLNNGDRTFDISEIPVGSGAFPSVAAGYFNNDAFLDFVISGTVLFGDGTGNLVESGSLPVEAYAVEVADFNRDGHDDLAIASRSYSYITKEYSYNAYILVNNGNGSFLASDSLDIGGLSITAATGNALADFNNDGNPDFIVCAPHQNIPACSNATVITVILGDGSGHIQSTNSYEICDISYNLVTADVNRDNELDFVVTNALSKTLEIFLGNGDGTFVRQTPISLQTDSLTFALATADLDRDGRPDFISGGGVIQGDNIISAITKFPDTIVIPPAMVTTGYSSVALKVINPQGFEIARNKKTVSGSYYWRRDVNNDNSLDEITYDYNAQYGDYAIVFRKKDGINTPAFFDADIKLGDSKKLRIFKDYETPGTAKSSGANDSIVFRISISPNRLTSPESGEMEADNTPKINWSGLTLLNLGASISYEFQLDSKLDFNSPLESAGDLTNPFYTVSTVLDKDAVYYWRVRSFDGATYSDWSNSMAMYIGPFFCGDCDNNNAGLNVLDLTYLVDFIFRGGSEPAIAELADLNGDSVSGNILDLTALVDFMFRGGAKPTCGI